MILPHTWLYWRPPTLKVAESQLPELVVLLPHDLALWAGEEIPVGRTLLSRVCHIELRSMQFLSILDYHSHNLHNLDSPELDSPELVVTHCSIGVCECLHLC